jgi:hypothetical protein
VVFVEMLTNNNDRSSELCYKTRPVRLDRKNFFSLGGWNFWMVRDMISTSENARRLKKLLEKWHSSMHRARPEGTVQATVSV